MESERLKFVETPHCTDKLHCRTCRDRIGGERWRKSLLSLFVLPDNNPNFECPFGKAWHNETAAPPCPTCGKKALKAPADKTKVGGCNSCARKAQKALEAKRLKGNQ